MTGDQFHELLTKTMELQQRVVHLEDHPSDDELVILLSDALAIVAVLTEVIEDLGPLHLS